MKSVIGNNLKINVGRKTDVEIGKELRLELKIKKDIGNISNLKVLFNRYGENPSIIKEMIKTKEDNNYITYNTTQTFEMYGNYYFFFSLDIDGNKKAIKINRENNKPYICNENEESPYWIILVLQENFRLPEWTKNTIYYQIFVDRFNKSKDVKMNCEGRKYRIWGEMPNWKKNENGEYHNNDFFGGNLKGIKEKIGYLKQLNIGVIYLSPINESLYRYDRYASTNHLKIDPDVGTYEDLKDLHEEANKKGMHLILDIALNHCSFDNPIFQKALNDPNSKYRDWFIFDQNGNYKYWYNEFKDMPIFNQKNEEFRKYVYEVISTFSKYVDGFRLDVAEELSKEVLEIIRKAANESEAFIFSKEKKSQKRIIIGECWEEVKDPTVLGKCLDTVTNYPYTDAIKQYVKYGDFEHFKGQVEKILEIYPKETLETMLNSLDTHDIPRALTILGGKYMRKKPYRIWKIDEYPSKWHVDTQNGIAFFTDKFRKFEFEHDILEKQEYENSKQLLKLAIVLQYFLLGNPCIFYGTEVGVHGYKDPFNRKCFPLDNMDTELLNFYIKIGKIRSKVKLTDANWPIIYGNSKYLVYEVTSPYNKVLVAVNRSEDFCKIPINDYYSYTKKIYGKGSKEDIIAPKNFMIFIK